MAGSVSSVYVNVVDDVIRKVRGEFDNSGAGDAVLSELQAIWETKMMQSGVISGNIERQPIPRAVHDLNVTYEGPFEGYVTPTAEMLFPPTPLQTPMRTPGMNYNIPIGPSDFSVVNDIIDIKAGRPSPYMQPPSPWMNQRPLGVDVNVAYEEGRDEVERGSSHQPTTQDFFIMPGKRQRTDYTSQLTTGAYFPQQDGSGDITIEFFLPEGNGVQDPSGEDRSIAMGASSDKEAKATPVLPQRDGANDEYDNLFHYGGVATEDYNAINTPADDDVELRIASVGTPMPTKSEAVEDDEPPLNEDDDDDDDLDELARGEELQTQHLVLAKFEKVTRTKSKWKCILKDGIMHLNNRDVLFNKATGEFDF